MITRKFKTLASGNGLRIAYVTVTPELAAKWLSLNTNNRHLSQPAVDKFKRDLESGNFHTTHQGIAFYDDHSLADGQHRLTAIHQSGVAARLAVTWGLPREHANDIDGGRSRQFGDRLFLARPGIGQNAKRVGAILLKVHGLSTGQLMAGVGRATDTELIATFDRNAACVEWAAAFAATAGKGYPASTIWGPLAYAYSAYPDEIQTLADQLTSGIGMASGSATNTLWRWISRRRADGVALTGHIVAVNDTILRVLHAAMHAVQGRKLERLYATEDGWAFFSAKRFKMKLDREARVAVPRKGVS